MDREEISPNLNNNAADPSGADGSSSRHRSVRVKRGRTDLASFHTSDSVFDEFEEPEEKRSKRGGYRRGRSAMKNEEQNGGSIKSVSSADADQQQSALPAPVQPTLSITTSPQDLPVALPTNSNAAVEPPTAAANGEQVAPIASAATVAAIKPVEETSASAVLSTTASPAVSSAAAAAAPAAPSTTTTASLLAAPAPAAPKLSRGALAAATRAKRKAEREAASAEREAASVSPSRDRQTAAPSSTTTATSSSTTAATFPEKVSSASVAASQNQMQQMSGNSSSHSSSNVIVGPVLYRPGKSLGLLSGHMGQLLKVHIHAQYLTAKNEQLVTRQIWGNKVYTDDSDVVAMICHAGFFTAKNSVPEFEGVSVLLRILPGQTSYPAVTQNDVQSRKWPQHEVSLSVESVSALPFGELGKNLVTLPRKTELSRKEQQRGSNYVASQIAEGDETQQLLMFEQQRQRHVFPDSVIMYNLSNEICKKYTLGTVIDRGLEKSQWTSYRLKHEVLYFEHLQNRYELSRVGTAKEYNSETNSYDVVDRYRWCLVSNPIAADLMRRKFANSLSSASSSLGSSTAASSSTNTRKGKKEKAEKETSKPNVDFSLAAVPLPSTAVKVLEDQLDWSEFEWSTSGVSIRGKDTPLAKVFWRPIQDVSSLPSPPNTQHRSKR